MTWFLTVNNPRYNGIQYNVSTRATGGPSAYLTFLCKYINHI